jgi:hypothetical protein
MVAVLWVLSILFLLFALFCTIKAKKLERRAAVVLERLEQKRQLEKRFSGRQQNQSLVVDRAAARARALRPKPTRFV